MDPKVPRSGTDPTRTCVASFGAIARRFPDREPMLVTPPVYESLDASMSGCPSCWRYEADVEVLGRRSSAE